MPVRPNTGMRRRMGHDARYAGLARLARSALTALSTVVSTGRPEAASQDARAALVAQSAGLRRDALVMRGRVAGIERVERTFGQREFELDAGRKLRRHGFERRPEGRDQ